jgi:3-deoxy-manno-octulosonate cytidylyltransferase (CMP-KDO synthetase)
VKSFGGKVQMTKSNHQNGTERCAEIVQSKTDVDLVINIQGDEPFIAQEQIDLLIDQLLSQGKGIASLAKRIDKMEDWLNPNIVKVLFDEKFKVLYFSRAPLPYHRDTNNTNWNNEQKYYKHIGLYGYYRNTLLEITKLAPSPLELAESLEQLRWLENGYTIGISITNTESIAVDTKADIQKAEEWFRKQFN